MNREALWWLAVTVLSLASFASVPVGLFIGILGLSGNLMDAGRGENAEAGVIWLGIGGAPPTLLALLCLWRRPRKEARGFPVEAKPGGKGSSGE